MNDNTQAPETTTDVDPAAAIDAFVGVMRRMDLKIHDIQDMLVNQEAPKSSIDKLFTALAKAQGQMHNAEMDATNPHYGSSYATLASCLSAVREPLSANGLSLMQLPGRKVEGNGVELLTLTTILGHTSGQSIENYFEMYPPKKDPQGIGSAMTYMRRYALMAICGIAGSHDDDAEAAAAEAPTITPAEADQILVTADELFGSDADQLLERMCSKVFGVEGVPKIPEGQANVAINALNNQKKRMEAAKQKPVGKKKTDSPTPDDDDIPVA
jgi:hypothetical protein